MHLFLPETVASTEAAQQAGGSLGSMSNLLSFMLLVMLFGMFGYCVYSALKLKKTYLLFPNKILYAGNCRPEDCLDPYAYVEFIWPKVLLLGLGMLLCGVFCLLCLLVPAMKSSFLCDILLMVIPVTMLVLYLVAQNRGAKRFW